jgi:phosphoribosylglycinamide formyltransferase-1
MMQLTPDSMPKGSSTPIQIALFASGSGTNAEAICRHFQHHPAISVGALFVNRKNAGVINRLAPFGIPTIVFDRPDFYEHDEVLAELRRRHIDVVVLAGFLWLIPPSMIQAYPRQIINIHPALLPAYGGKGMYGMHIHREVIRAGERQSGITIHLVSEEYDKGEVLFQATVEVAPIDSPESLAEKIHTLEHVHFSRVIESYICQIFPDIASSYQ